MRQSTWQPLQWGHGDGAVEEIRLAAKIGPARDWLQWGHGDGAVEEQTGSFTPDSP